MVAMDARNGEILWSIADPSNALAFGPVTLANGVLFAGSTHGKGPIYAMNATTGKVLWSYDTGGTVYRGIALPPLARMMLPNKGSTVRTAAWALSNLIKGPDPKAATELIRVDGRSNSSSFEESTLWDEELATEVAWVVVYLSALSNIATGILVKSNVLQLLVERLATSNSLQLLIPLRNTNYIPVQLTVSIVEEYPEKPEVGVKAEEQLQSSSSGTRKKVTFDSNVRTYEHILPEHVSGTLPEKDEVGTKEEESLGKSGHSQPSSAASSITSSSGSYLPNHRYQNCRECDDEEDKIDYEDTDLDDEDDDGVVDYDDMYEEDGIVESKIDVAKEEIEEAVKPIRGNRSARDRSAYIHSIRNPVENLTQWKALKMKGKLQSEQ
ncbi:hypothetical protein EZV62_016988 [Acer yangbiense]|uniref:Pyrrolo-quinoline quinone repeat domain-containing protein n=1 Tax=Acer yangbiense TaxID=1000413 RepID=A0A5C7HQR7_9ROSI|nr:hypothetical protein EZV62_016988 [Acer yangbiense]